MVIVLTKITKQLINLSRLNYPICQIVNYRLDNEDCIYVTKIARFISLHTFSWFKSYVKAIARWNDRLSQNLVTNIDYAAVDFYSIDELVTSKLGQQWTKFWKCSYAQAGLAYIERIFVISGRHLHDRHEHLKNVFRRHSIDDQSIEWRWRWNQTLCQSDVGQREILERMNLQGDHVKFRDNMEARQCAVTMEHVELWHDIALRNFSLTLILEDDVIFVPFFREKFNCFMNEILKGGTLMGNANQQLMFVIGGCFGFHGQAFNYTQADAIPLISFHKTNASRCSHAYSLTSKSARTLVNEIKRQKNSFAGSDIFLRDMFARSVVLDSVWLDPPLAYQGNQILNLNTDTLFKKKSY